MGRFKDIDTLQKDAKYLRTGQTKKASMLETCLNVILGFAIAMLAQIIIFPLFNIHVSEQEHLAIGGLFTVVSVARSYALRRLFNYLHVKGIYV